jgi:hypothetical protein
VHACRIALTLTRAGCEALDDRAVTEWLACTIAPAIGVDSECQALALAVKAYTSLSPQTLLYATVADIRRATKAARLVPHGWPFQRKREKIAAWILGRPAANACYGATLEAALCRCVEQGSFPNLD